ncbi:DoxX family membrane protein [Falsiroseomonas sp.]|uniref:DoxX family membrane protein n=1 Tax=Falsiroseomonas sp. TaxID=2870721 RepID=UPI0034A1A7B0
MANPPILGAVIAIAEIAAGLALIAGVWVRLASLLTLPIMIGAITQHLPAAGCSAPRAAGGRSRPSGPRPFWSRPAWGQAPSRWMPIAWPAVPPRRLGFQAPSPAQPSPAQPLNRAGSPQQPPSPPG